MTMPRCLSTSLHLIVSVCLIGCGGGRTDTTENEVTDAAAGSGGAGKPQEPSKAGAGGAAPVASDQVEAPTDESATAAFEGSFEACVAALKPVCGYDEKGTPCASLRTPNIPLTSGGAYGDEELKAGAYGGFVAWNQVLETGGNVTGHLTLMEQPDRVVEPTVAWWQYMLKGDQSAKKLFDGADCGLCKTPEAFEAGARRLP